MNGVTKICVIGLGELEVRTCAALTMRRPDLEIITVESLRDVPEGALVLDQGLPDATERLREYISESTMELAMRPNAHDWDNRSTRKKLERAPKVYRSKKDRRRLR